MSELFNHYLFNDANLLYYCRFEGNSNDSKGSRNGTDTTITYAVSNGRWGQGAGFNGTSSNISLGLNSFSNANVASGSIILYFKQNGIPATSDRNIYNIEGYLSIELETSTGYLKTQTDGTPTYATKSVNVCDNQWHQAAVTWTSTNTSLYLDGTGVVTSSPTGSPTPDALSRSVRFGSDHTGTINFFPGSLDDAAQWDRVLTAAEILSVWNTYTIKNNLRPRIFAPGIAR